MFYLIGLGLDLNSISKEALEICRKAGKVYVEMYTVEFPYDVQKLGEVTGRRIIPLTRIMVENEKFVDEARNKDIALLVYGAPLMATTHISLVLKCKQEKINYKILQNAGIFDAISETGLQVYKFGKTASLPKWEKNFKPESFIEIIKENQEIKAHTLILVDIGLAYHEALKQLEQVCRKHHIDLKNIVVCSRLGTEKRKIYFASIQKLYGAEVYSPFCFILPSEMHFLELDALEILSEKI